MINRIKKIALSTFILSSSAYLMADCPLNILNPEINPKPLTYLSTGNVSFEILEDRGTAIPATDSFGDPTCLFNVELSYVMLENNDTTNITGGVLDYFDVEYNVSDRRVYFTQNKEIPADTYEPGIISIDVTEESTSEQKYNGFQLNVYASSVEGSQFTYTKKVVLPPVPLTVDGTDVNETDSTTVLTNNTTPEINGTCDVGNTVTVQIDGVDIDPTVDCSSDGTFSIIPTDEISDGEYSITTTQYYADENTTSDPSPVDTLNVDTTAPEPLTIDSVDGQTGTPVTTTDATPEITGTCAYNDNGTVIVQVDGVDIAPTATCTSSGTYSVTPTTPLTVGEHNITATESDEAGNSTTTPAVALTVDEPTVPETGISTIDGNDTTETVTTNNPNPEITGTCESGDTVTVQIDGVDIDPTAICSTSGTFTITPTTPITEGEHNVTTTQTNPNGETSNPSPVDTLNVDTTAPEPLTIDSVDGKTGTPVTTTDATPEITGTCEAGGEVVVQIDGVDIDPTAICSTSGTYSITPTTPLSVGEHNVTTTESDEAGNSTTTPAVALTVDEPIVPETVVSTIDGNDTTGTVTTNNPNPEITGTCESGDTVTVQIDGVDIEPTVTCSTSGTFTITPTTPITEGEHTLTTTQTNPNGETSNPSPVDTLNVDTTAPEPLTIGSVDGKTGTPVTTTDATPEITGTCEAGGEVVVQIDGVDIDPTAICSTSGTYSITPTTPLTVGSHNVTVTESDEAGNSTTTPAVALTVDEPTVPETGVSTIDGNDTTGTVTTNNPNPEITGTCVSGDTVTVQIDGVDIEPTVTCSTSGTFTITPTTPITEGEHTLTTTQTNSNGETSNPSSAISLVVNSVDSNSGISGYVWFDENGNGIQDESKGNGVVEVDVILLNSSGEVIERTKTDAHGNYKLNNLVEGEDYTVKFSIPNSYNTTTKGVTNDDRDSDVNSDGSVEIINFKKGGETLSMGINCDCSNGSDTKKVGASTFGLASLLVMLLMINFMAKREN